MPKSTAKIPAPLHVALDTLWGGWRSFALAAAVELDVFTAIKEGATTAAQGAISARANNSAMRRLLDTLVSIKYLTRNGERYALTPQAAVLSDAWQRVPHGRHREAYQHVDDGMAAARAGGERTGQPTIPTDDSSRAAFFAILVKCIFPLNFAGATAAVASLKSSARARIKRVLDVAAGAAASSIPFAQAIRAATITVVDLPEVTPVTRDYTSRFAVGDRYEYREVNLREVDFGSGYDLVILGHIIHGEGRVWGRKFIERSSAAVLQAQDAAHRRDDPQ